MKMIQLKATYTGLLLCLCGTLLLRADVRLPAIFSDHMVLQQGKAVAVWGWADPGEQVTVQFGSHSAKTKADNQGVWKVELAKLPASATPADLKVTGKNDLVIKDVLVGEVWVCSGQSNMGMTVDRCLNAQEEIAKSANPQIRMFRVPLTVADEPQKDLVKRDAQSVWLEADPKHTGAFTAAGYFMGRELQKELKVPIGLINTSWGGTRAEAWTSKPALEAVPCCRPIISGWETFLKTYDVEKDRAQYDASVKSLNAKIQKIKADNAKPGAKQQALPRAARPWENRLTSQHRPSVLFNAMIAPIVPYTARGAIWYQGESNQGRAEQYLTLLPTMIADWRKQWNDKFSFYIVQLASYGNGKAQPQPIGTNDTWAELQWTELQTALNVPKCGLAVANDVGEEKDIHPRNKQEVGRRLALQALAQDYGRTSIAKDGPMYASAKFSGGKCTLSFKNAKGGLKSRDGGELKGFIIAGADKAWKSAQAKIVGDQIQVWNDEIAKPAAVRYYWTSWNPEANLVNNEGLPASLFRTDDWELSTKGEQNPFPIAAAKAAAVAPSKKK